MTRAQLYVFIRLDETAETEVLLDDNIIDGGHDESNLRCISRAREVSVDLFRLMLIQADKSVQDIVAGQCIIITTLVVRKVILHWAHWELLLETIDLVQEQNYRRLDEPSRVANRIEQGEGFLHTVHCLVFEQKLVVLRNGDKEEYGGDILEAMDPLLSLRTLSSNIKHAICKVTNDESSLRDSSGLDTGTKNILIVRHIVVLGDTLNVVKVVSG